VTSTGLFASTTVPVRVSGSIKGANGVARAAILAPYSFCPCRNSSDVSCAVCRPTVQRLEGGPGNVSLEVLPRHRADDGLPPDQPSPEY
jgi:hypothetical protein